MPQCSASVLEDAEEEAEEEEEEDEEAKGEEEKVEGLRCRPADASARREAAGERGPPSTALYEA